MKKRKKIVVFGGTSGLGVKLTPLLEQKYDVISLGSRDVDITKFDKVKEFFEMNDIDIVLNMSGKNYDTYIGKIDENNHDIVENMIDVNVLGNVNILAACIPQLITKKWGRVILISSVLSEMNIPKAVLYSASKAFIDRLVSGTNKENVRFGVTCNSIQLGYWDGGMRERLKPEFQDAILKTIGLRRWGSIEELYNTIVFMVENEYLCGINLKIDGGL